MKRYCYPGETQILEDATRASTSGEYILLSQGFTHYDLAGPENTQTVMVIHGFSIPYQIWDPDASYCLLIED